MTAVKTNTSLLQSLEANRAEVHGATRVVAVRFQPEGHVRGVEEDHRLGGFVNDGVVFDDLKAPIVEHERHTLKTDRTALTVAIRPAFREERQASSGTAGRDHHPGARPGWHADVPSSTRIRSNRQTIAM